MSLDILPIELVYKILDNLDVQTIIFSFQNVCRKFYAITHTYNRYELDLSAISKVNFHRICRIIRPENIISLTLSDHDTTPGQIPLFMSLFNKDQFVGLRSLTLVGIEKTQLNRLMNYVDIKSLNTLSINIRKNNYQLEDVSISPLLSNIVMSNLHKLELTMWSHDINEFVWPKQSTLRHLTVGHYVTCKQVRMILSRLTHLRTLVIRNGVITEGDETVTTLSENEKNTNLISLTFKNSRLQMDELELLLSLVPSLVHLQLTSTVSSSDAILNGSHWEEFIQSKLPLLEKFEFFFRAQIDRNHNSTDIEPWISPFRTPFWVKYKSWFVTCNYAIRTATLRLFTVPICDSYITYESNFDKITCTTYADIDNDTFTMNNVRELQLDLTLLMSTVTVKTMTPRTNRLFHKLTDLTLTINGAWHSGSIEHLSTLIDLSQLATLGLHITIDHCFVPDTINNIDHLLQRAYNVRSLILANGFCGGSFNGIVENLCSIIPRHIKHLDVYDIDLDDIKIVLTRLKHLSSVVFAFFFNMPFSPYEIIGWLSQRRDFTYLVDNSSLSIWLGNNVNVHSEYALIKSED